MLPCLIVQTWISSMSMNSPEKLCCSSHLSETVLTISITNVALAKPCNCAKFTKVLSFNLKWARNSFAHYFLHTSPNFMGRIAFFSWKLPENAFYNPKPDILLFMYELRVTIEPSVPPPPLVENSTNCQSPDLGIVRRVDFSFPNNQNNNKKNNKKNPHLIFHRREGTMSLKFDIQTLAYNNKLWVRLSQIHMAMQILSWEHKKCRKAG